MNLYSRSLEADSHRVRLVLAEKGITCDICEILDDEDLSEDLLHLNPYQSLPTLVDRDLVLYEPWVIMEYLDERFPHPPLMPVDPVSRARVRLSLHRFEKDWYDNLDTLQGKGDKRASTVRKQIKEGLMAANDVFAASEFFLSDEMSLADCSIAPILWRLPSLGIELPKQAQGVIDYADRMFKRRGFQASLSEPEQELRS